MAKKCDFCKEAAKYDGKTKAGPWAFMCEVHMEKYGIKLPGLCMELVDPEIPRECSLCGELKSITKFYKYTDGTGVKRYRTECKKCNLAERKKRSFK